MAIKKDKPYEGNSTRQVESIDLGTVLQNQIAQGASAQDVADTLGQRVKKASRNASLNQYAYDDIYQQGMDYIMEKNKQDAADFSYADYASAYQQPIQQLTQDILGRAPFSYDYSSDPLYQQYAESYTREGNRAMQDTLGQVSARTGGLASSYAGTAATQANQYYMSQLADKIPELQQLAYSMYQDQGNEQRQNLSMLQGLDNTDYGRYQDDRSFDYGVHSDTWDRNFSREQYDDALAQQLLENQRYDQEYSDAQAQENRDRTLGLLQQYAGLGGNINNVNPQLLESAGVTRTFIQPWFDQYAQANAVESGGGTKSGSGTKSGGSNNTTTQIGAGDRIYQDLWDLGIRTEGDAYAYLLNTGAKSQAGKLAGFFADWIESGGGQPDSISGRVHSDESQVSEGYDSTWQNARRLYDSGKSKDAVVNYLSQRYDSGMISDRELEMILDSLGLD